MNITKKELKQLINEVLSETDFNPFKQGGRGIAVKSDATAAANAAAQAEFDKNIKKKSVSNDVDYEPNYNLRINNLIKNRNDLYSKLKSIENELTIRFKNLPQIKSGEEQKNFYENHIVPLISERETLLRDLLSFNSDINDTWNSISRDIGSKIKI